MPPQEDTNPIIMVFRMMHGKVSMVLVTVGSPGPNKVWEAEVKTTSMRDMGKRTIELAQKVRSLWIFILCPSHYYMINRRS